MSGMIDRFVHDRMPPGDRWPVMDYGVLPELAAYPGRLNCGVELLDRMVETGFSERPVLTYEGAVWRYADLLERSNRIARVLIEDMGVQPGNRVLLRGANTPTMIACWFAAVKAGAVVVATMPLLRARELSFILEKAGIDHALCEESLAGALDEAAAASGRRLDVRCFTALGDGDASLDRAMTAKPSDFDAFDSDATDPALIAFTSGTTGEAKGTVHFHRDLLAVCDTYAAHINRLGPDDIVCGSPPLAFTFGLGGLVLFPMRVGASTALAQNVSPEGLLALIERQGATCLYTAPTAYRAMLGKLDAYDIGSLKTCVSAGEHLPIATWQAWRDATGVAICDGIGATEMLHIFISARGGDIRPGSTGKIVPGYEARIVDAEGAPLPPGEPGWLSVRGPTGCRYLDNPARQAAYVRDGWNITGDIFRQDEDGYFWYVARGDDMIISSGYNIAGPEVENCLLTHPDIAECAVVGAPDPERGHVVAAFVVLRDGVAETPETGEALQAYVKSEIAPYKYPRIIRFVDALPKTPTGKLQRFRLRDSLSDRKAGETS